MKKLSKSTRFKIYIALGVIALFFLWWLIAYLVNSPLFPTPITTFPVFFSYLGQGSTYMAIGGTFLRIIIAFGISFILGAILGTLAGYFYRLEAFLKPFILVLRTLPTAAVVLILVALLKPMWLPIIVSSLVMFPLIYEAFLNGIKNIDKSLKDELKADNANPFNAFFRVYLPISTPYILLAVVQSFGLGMKVSIMAEIVGGSNQIVGLGRLIHMNFINANSVNVIALSLIAILIIVLIDIALHYAKRSIKDGKE